MYPNNDQPSQNKHIEFLNNTITTAANFFIESNLLDNEYDLARRYLKAHLFGINVGFRMAEDKNLPFGEAVKQEVVTTGVDAGIDKILGRAAMPLEIITYSAKAIDYVVDLDDLQNKLEQRIRIIRADERYSQIEDDLTDHLIEMQSAAAGMKFLAEAKDYVTQKIIGLFKTAPLESHPPGFSPIPVPQVSSPNIPSKAQEPAKKLPEFNIYNPFMRLHINIGSLSDVNVVKYQEKLTTHLNNVEQRISQEAAELDDLCEHYGIRQYFQSHDPRDSEQPKMPGTEAGNFLRKHSPKLLDAAEKIANAVFRLQNIRGQSEQINRRRQQIISECEMSLKNLNFEIDLRGLATKYSSLPEIRQEVYARFEGNFYLRMYENHQAYKQAKENHKTLKADLKQHEKLLADVKKHRSEIQQAQRRVRFKLYDLDDNIVLPTMSTCMSTLSTILPPDVAVPILIFTAAMNMIAANKAAKKDSKFQLYKGLFDRASTQLQVLASIETQLLQDKTLLLSLDDQIRLDVLDVVSAKKQRECLKEQIKKIDERMSKIQQARAEIVKNKGTLEKDIKKQEKVVASRRGHNHRHKHRADSRLNQMNNDKLVFKVALEKVDDSYEKAEKDRKRLKRLLRREKQLASIKDWHDAYFKKLQADYYKGMSSADIKKHRKLVRMRNYAQDKFQEYQRIYAYQDQVIHTFGNNISQTLHAYSSVFRVLSYGKTADSLQAAARVAQAGTIIYTIARVINNLIFNANQLQQFSRGGVITLQTLKNYGVLQLINQFVNPSLGIMMLSAQLINLGTLMRGLNLFPDPVIANIEQLNDNLGAKLDSLKGQLNEIQKRVDSIKGLMSEHAALIESGTVATHRLRDAILPSLTTLTNDQNSKKGGKILKEEQTIERRATELSQTPDYKSYEYDALLGLFENFNTMIKQFSDSRFTEIVYSDSNGMPYIDNTLDSINLLTSNAGSQQNRLMNYRLLYLTINHLVLALVNFLHEKYNKNNSQSVYDVPKVKLALARISQILLDADRHLQNLQNFIMTSKEDIARVDALKSKMLTRILTIVEQFNDINPMSHVSDSNRLAQRDTAVDYLMARSTLWIERLTNNNVTRAQFERIDTLSIANCNVAKQKLLHDDESQSSEKLGAINSYLEQRAVASRERRTNYSRIVASVLRNLQGRLATPSQLYVEIPGLFSGKGLLVFDHYGYSLPMFFPEELIAKLNKNDELKTLFYAEKQALGIVVIDYILKKDEASNNIQLSLRYSFKKNRSDENIQIPCVDICVASFDSKVLEPYRMTATRTAGADDEYNTDEFLQDIIYGSERGIICADAYNNFSKGHNPNNVCYKTLPFVGLFKLWQRNSNCAFLFDPQLYDTDTASAFKQFVNLGTSSNKILDFMYQEHAIEFCHNMTEFNWLLKIYRDNVWSRDKEESISTPQKQIIADSFKELFSLYETLTAMIRLNTSMDYHSAVTLIYQHLSLPHPYLLKALYDNDIQKFICYATLLSQACKKHNATSLVQYLSPMEGITAAAIDMQRGMLSEAQELIKRHNKDKLDSFRQLIVQALSDNCRLTTDSDSSRNAVLTELNSVVDILLKITPDSQNIDEVTEKPTLAVEYVQPVSASNYQPHLYPVFINLLNSGHLPHYRYCYNDGRVLCNELATLSDSSKQIYYPTKLYSDDSFSIAKTEIAFLKLIPIFTGQSWCAVLVNINRDDYKVNVTWLDFCDRTEIPPKLPNLIKMAVIDQLQQLKTDSDTAITNYQEYSSRWLRWGSYADEILAETHKRNKTGDFILALSNDKANRSVVVRSISDNLCRPEMTGPLIFEIMHGIVKDRTSLTSKKNIDDLVDAQVKQAITMVKDSQAMTKCVYRHRRFYAKWVSNYQVCEDAAYDAFVKKIITAIPEVMINYDSEAIHQFLYFCQATQVAMTVSRSFDLTAWDVLAFYKKYSQVLADATPALDISVADTEQDNPQEVVGEASTINLLRCGLFRLKSIAVQEPKSNAFVSGSDRIDKSQFTIYPHYASDVLNAPIHIPGLQWQQMPGDNHCLFHAISRVLNVDVQTLRNNVADYYLKNVNNYRHFEIAMSPQAYAKNIRGDLWAGEIELDILMHITNRRIVVVLPNGQISNLDAMTTYKGEPLFVYYNGINHYDALLLADGQNGLAILQRLYQTTMSERAARRCGG